MDISVVRATRGFKTQNKGVSEEVLNVINEGGEAAADEERGRCLIRERKRVRSHAMKTHGRDKPEIQFGREAKRVRSV